MNITFEQKVVVITGAVGGLGSAMCRRFAEDGATVIVCDLRGTADAVAALTEGGYRAFGMEFDITDREATRAAMEEIAKAYGGIDVRTMEAMAQGLCLVEDSSALLGQVESLRSAVSALFPLP